jgi:hypothetical protein
MGTGDICTLAYDLGMTILLPGLRSELRRLLPLYFLSVNHGISIEKKSLPGTRQ